ncbi:MAG: 7-cyano-7-deazaguanine synthase [Gammaproteobacteria bacterium]
MTKSTSAVVPSPSLVLLSAGVESATLLHGLARQAGPSGARPAALFIDYGQRAADQELAHGQRLCDSLGVTLERLDIPTVGEAFRHGQTHSRHVPIPHRNLFLLATALCWAAQYWAPRRGQGMLYIALNRDDAAAHPDAAPPFLDRLNALAATLGPSRVVAPLLELGKADIVRQGHAEGLDYTLTYSCLLGHPQHCGGCPQCHSRQRAFAEAGVDEPADFYRRPVGREA